MPSPLPTTTPSNTLADPTMAYRRSPASQTTISLPSFAQAFRSPSPTSYNAASHHSHPMPSSRDAHARNPSNSSNNHLPPLRYTNSTDSREELRRGDSADGRKRPHEELEREGARNEREQEESAVKPEPFSAPSSPVPKRQRTQHLSPNTSIHSHNSSSTGPGQAPVSPVVAGFAIDPSAPEQAMDQVRRSLGLKQQQQAIIQSRKEQAEGGGRSSDRDREHGREGWHDHPTNSPHLSQPNSALQQRSPGQQSQQPPSQQQRTLPPPTVASRRGPLTASKAASLTIQTSTSGSGSPAYTSTFSRDSERDTHTLHPASHGYGRPALGHPTSALRGLGADLQQQVRSAPPQQTRFAVPPLQSRPEAGRSPHSQLGAGVRPIMSISQTSREMQRERGGGREEPPPTAGPAQTPREHRGMVSSVPLSRSAQRTPSVLRPIQREQHRDPSPPMTGSTTAVSSISRRPTFERQSQTQPNVSAGASGAGHFYPFGGTGAPGSQGAPMQTAPLPGRGDILQQQQAAAITSHHASRGLPGQYPPPTAGLPPPTAGTSAAAAGAAHLSSMSGLENLTLEQKTFLHPFLTFYDSILDSQKLKEWLKKEIERAGRANQSLLENHAAIERLIGSAVGKVREEMRAEREEWERSVVRLEKRIRELEGRSGAEAERPASAANKRPESEKGKQPEMNGMAVDEPARSEQ